ncbi:MAG TPA: DinB family protein [Chitinophagaceae bacterium]|nr:DinB family protein [Chitinophagaceae bacterium]
MAIKDALIAELTHEGNSTKKLLSRVPMDKADWKPHEKSMSLGDLAKHVADIPHWINSILNKDDFDFQKHYKGFQVSSFEELMKLYQEKIDEALVQLANANDEEMMKPWIMRSGDHVIFEAPKVVAIRSVAMNHLIHHRGQLTVYLRLLNIAIPGMYGPSADEPM